MKNLLKVFLISIILATNVSADTDGEIDLSKKAKPIKDCFESLNRGSFALNQGLDKVIFKPVASLYKSLPSPIRTGTSNALSNLSNLITFLIFPDFNLF